MPSRHLGASATALERRGIKTRIGDGNRAAASLNALAGQLEAEQAACVSLTEQAKRAAARPTPQKGAEAPHRALSSPSPVERASTGLGSLHGAAERREGTPAAVRLEAARPTPQKAVEAPQRAVVAQQPLDTLEGAKLLPRIEQAKKDQRVALEAVDIARRNRERAEWELAVCRRDIEAHNAEFKEMGFLKKSLKCGEINRKATALDEKYTQKAAALAETKKAEEKAEAAERHTTTALQKLQAAYVQTPHAKAVKEQERVKEEQERKARAARREREKLKRALERDDEWER